MPRKIEIVEFIKDSGFAEAGDRGRIVEANMGQYLVYHNAFKREAWIDRECLRIVDQILIDNSRQKPLWEGEL